MIMNYIKEMRVHHYIKNFIILFPLFFSRNLFDVNLVYKSIIGFICFSLMSSAIYVYNDIKDIENDRNHPIKKNRPIASGKISTKHAYFFVLILIIMSIAINSLSFTSSLNLLLISFLIINILYSQGLKNIPIIDISIIALGYFARLLYGSVITGIAISNWLYIFMFSATFFLALGKRRNELLDNGIENTRKVLKNYPLRFLDQNLYVFMTLSIIFYALWTIDTNSNYSVKGNLIYSNLLVIIIFLRYSFLLENNSSGDPVDVVIHDKIILGLASLYVLVMLYLLYYIPI